LGMKLARIKALVIFLITTATALDMEDDNFYIR
jgi:hypothetical protein